MYTEDRDVYWCVCVCVCVATISSKYVGCYMPPQEPPTPLPSSKSHLSLSLSLSLTHTHPHLSFRPWVKGLMFRFWGLRLQPCTNRNGFTRLNEAFELRIRIVHVGCSFS